MLDVLARNDVVATFCVVGDQVSGNEQVLRRQLQATRDRFQVGEVTRTDVALAESRLAAADGYVTGLEPAINFPNPKSFEAQQGRVAKLAPGESRSFEIDLDLHDGADAVSSAEAQVKQLQDGTDPVILDAPDPGWSAE